MIASALHTEGFFDRLAEKRIDVGSFLRCGRLVVRDAQAMLDTILRGGMPDEGAFRRAIGSVLESGRPVADVLATPGDECSREALSQASHDVFGLPLSRVVALPPPEPPGAHLLPPEQRTMLWMMRHVPSSSAEVLEQARVHYQQRFN